MESEPPILLYLFSFALALGTMARLHHQLVWQMCAMVLPCRSSEHRN